MDTSVIIPVRNECENVQPICEMFAKFIESHPYVREVIFVDDGSNDDTSGRLKTCSEQFSFVRFLNLEEPRGKGAAIKAGFQKSIGDVLVMMDGDQQYSPLSIPQLVKPIFSGEADVAAGRGSNGHSSPLRKSSSKCYRAIFIRLFGMPICSPNEGFKAITKKMFEQLPLTADGFDFDLELLVKAKQQAMRIVEVEVDRFERRLGTSKVRLLPTTLLFSVRMISLWLSQRKWL